MTEAEWLACDDILQLLSLIGFRYPYSRDKARGVFAADRKLRLFAVGCSLLPPVVLTDPRLLRTVEGAEQFADGEAGWQNHSSVDLDQLHHETIDVLNKSPMNTAERSAALILMSCTANQGAALAAEYAARHYCEIADPNGFLTPHDGCLAALLRDIFGNPFRPVVFSPEWRTSTAVALAKQMYESRDFSAMPILADALQDAECDNDDILNHCRDANGIHVRGCWVVDLVLGKE